MLEFNGTAIVLAISFVIFVILENFIFYKPMKKVLDERENYIADNEKSASDNLTTAQSLVEEKDKKIAEAKGKSSQLLNETSLKTQEKFDAAVKDAKQNSNAKLDELKNNLEEEKTAAQDELKKEIGTYAANIISKILKKEVSMVNVQDEVIEKALRGEL